MKSIKETCSGALIVVSLLLLTMLRATAAAPTISSISPNVGSTSGGNSVTIDGANLGFASSVTFGGTAATVAYNTTTGKLQPNAPAHVAGAVNVKVTTPSGSVTVINGYTYVGPPTISSISPNSGSTAGGNSVTIDGANLGFASSVTFGGTATTVAYNTTTGKLQPVAPTHSAGAANVTVTTPGGSVTSINGYTYVAPPTLTVTAPNGGESWAAGSTHNVTWTIGGDTSQISYQLVGYSTDAGSSYFVVGNDPNNAQQPAGARSFSWTLPSGVSTTLGRVQVTARAADTSIVAQDASDANFTISAVPPTLTVTAPNGGENWTAGTTHPITWSVSGNTANVWYWKVALSTDGGVTWPTAGTANDLTPDGINDPNARSFSWPISSPLNTTQARIRVRAVDFSGFIIASLSDASDANFTISLSATPDIRIEPVQLVFDFVSTVPALAGTAAIKEPNAFLGPEVILPDAVNQWQAAVAKGEVENPSLRKVAAVAPRAIPPEKLSAAKNLTSCDIFSFEDTAGILVTPGYTDAQRDQLMFNAANALLTQHGDNFDFVGFWLNFEPAHTLIDRQPSGAFYKHIENNVSGVGLSTFTNRSAFGLAGQNIEGLVMMWNVNNWTAGGASTRLILGQEFAHRFAMFLRPLLDGRRLQGDDAGCGRSSHWNFKVDGQGSSMEIAEWIGSSPVTRSGGALNFNSDIAGGLFSYIDLYLMGYVSAAEMDAGMSQMRYMDNGCSSPYSGPISTFNSANIIASNGARTPTSSTAQKNFRTGWIMIHQPGSPPSASEITKPLQIQEQMTTDWAASTLGRGQMDNSICPDVNSFTIYNDGQGVLSVTSISPET